MVRASRALAAGGGRLPGHHGGRHRREPRLLLGARPSCTRPGDKAVGASIRLGGLVAEGSVVRRPGSRRSVEFDVIDRPGGRVHVKCTGVPPQMFREQIGVVVEGTMTPRRLLRGAPADGLARATSTACPARARRSTSRRPCARPRGSTTAAQPQRASDRRRSDASSSCWRCSCPRRARWSASRPAPAPLGRGLAPDARRCAYAFAAPHGRGQPPDGLRAPGPRLQRQLRRARGLALACRTGWRS